MNRAADQLRLRRETLVLRGELQREGLRDHLRQIEETLDGVARKFSLVRRVARPPVLVVAGLAAALLLGRGRMKRALAGGIALLGLMLRVRSTGRILGQLAEWRPGRRQPPRDQLVSRSR
jgi:hypothetical protein